jgi:hypothetical protein
MRRFIFWLFLLGAGLTAGATAADLLAGAPAPLAEALQAFAQERDRWAYTERVISTDRKGGTKESKAYRFDPSLAPEDRWSLLEEDGQPAGEKAKKKFRRQMTKEGNKRIKLSEFLKLDRAVVTRSDAAATVYEVPLRKENNEKLPPEKFQVLVTVTPDPWRLASIDIVLREPMRMALVAKVRKGGARIAFARPTAEHNPVVRVVSGQGEATVLLIKVGGAFTAERTEFKRVTPFDERFQVKLQDLNYLDF